MDRDDPGAGHPHHGRQAGRPGPADRRGRARRLGGRGGEAARPRQEDRPGADRAAAGSGLVHRAGRVRPAPLDLLRDGEAAALRRRRGHRLRHHRRPPGLRVQPGRDGVRRQPRPGLRGEDRQDHRLRAEDRLPADRAQRGRRRPDPGGRGLPRPVRGDLPPQHPRLRGHPADLVDHGRGRRRARLLPRADRLRRDGRPDLADVHHRSGRDQDRHRRGRDAWRSWAAGVRTTPSPATRTTSAPTRRTRSPTSRRCSSYLPQNNLEDPPVFDVENDLDAARRRPRPRHADPRLAEPAVRHARGDLAGCSTTASSSRCRRCSRPTSWSASAGSTAAASGWWPTSRCTSPAAWTSTPPRRRPGSSAPATRSTSR